MLKEKITTLNAHIKVDNRNTIYISHILYFIQIIWYIPM